MIFCKKCGYMLDDDAKFCTECGTPTSDETTGPNGQQNGTDTPPYNGQGGYYYNPQGGYYQPPYGYYPPIKRPINVGMLVFTIINFVFTGLIAIWPLMYVINAKNAQNDADEAYLLEKAKNANIVCLVIGIIISAITLFADIAATMLM